MGLPGYSSDGTALRTLIVIGALALLPGCVRAFHSDSEQPRSPDAAADARVGDLVHISDGDVGAGDVGARDMLPAPANVVFYSVGHSTADHKTGAPSVSIGAGLATFSVPQTAVNLGVGDVVDYDADHKRCYSRPRSRRAAGTAPQPLARSRPR